VCKREREGKGGRESGRAEGGREREEGERERERKGENPFFLKAKLNLIKQN
jgi:hypothetical protein